MERSTTPDDRDPDRPIPTDPQTVARLEAENALQQFDVALEHIEAALRSEKAYRLRPSDVYHFNYLAIKGLSENPGIPRPANVTIHGSRHTPPSPHEVPALIEDMCGYVNENWDQSAVHLAAYLMWAINWIHPCEDGNGRTARIVSYVVLCIRLGYLLPASIRDAF